MIHEGNVRLFDQQLFIQLAHHLKGKHFSLIKVDGTFKYIEGNLAELIELIGAHLPAYVFPFEVIDDQIL